MRGENFIARYFLYSAEAYLTERLQTRYFQTLNFAEAHLMQPIRYAFIATTGMALATSLQPAVSRADIGTVNPSDCFNTMVQSHFDLSQRESLTLSSFALLDQKSWDSLKADGSGVALIPALGLFKGDFNADRTRITEFFRYNELDASVYRSTLMSSTWINDGGYAVISKCLDVVEKMTSGFRYTYRASGRDTVYVQLFWTSNDPRPTDTVILKDSQLGNGIVKTRKADRDSLFPANTPVGRGSVPIRITRLDLDKPISIILDTNLPEGPGMIEIPPVPAQRPLYWSVREVDSNDDGSPHMYEQRPFLTGGKNDVYDVSFPLSGDYVFQGLPTCTLDPTYPTSFVDLGVCDVSPDRKTLTVTGVVRANPRRMIIHWQQAKVSRKCVLDCRGDDRTALVSAK